MERALRGIPASPGIAVGIGTPTLVETGIVLATRWPTDARSRMRDLVDTFQLSEIPFVEDHWPIALTAFSRYGRGRHPARLNFGDCMTYAVARLSNQPLLFVCDDFSQTDLEAA